MVTKSSYAQNNYCKLFRFICYFIKPKKIVEFGILDGYSLDCFAEQQDCTVEANDIFEEFKYNAASYTFIKDKYANLSNVTINKKDFFNSSDSYEDNSIDILHIDIANDGDTYEYAIQNYWPKVKSLMIMEGGSEERDNVQWMIDYNKPKIQPVLEKYKNTTKLKVLEDFPSVTIFVK